MGGVVTGRAVVAGRRRGAGTDVWLTPGWVLAPLGPFDLDPCAAPLGAGWPTAARHFVHPVEDGLVLPWHGRVFLNPPYGQQVGPWMRRMAAHGHGTALTFARTDARWFFDWVWEAADALLFLRGRVRFVTPTGVASRDNGGAPSVLAAYGPEDVERLMGSGLDGQIVGLRRPVLVALALDAAEPPEGWREAVVAVVRRLGGRATLAALYEALARHPNAARNRHWRAKVRQTVGRIGLVRTGRGEYGMVGEVRT